MCYALANTPYNITIEKYISLLIQESLENKDKNKSKTLEYEAWEEKLNQLINPSIDVNII
ncbi:hypothetical protein WH8501_06335 [Crocosphaera watsonii WH 8501]|uniref:Uncharacterized protein n=3 Tax=Crocosphaera watsonii TaxID=263511 RepID=T2JM07_CROWT|nr:MULTISPECIES: hypothetical protein [Crocosphaera]EHJ14146.1 hypothetical protein CWATWH0003_1182 [Crocosphaera watsonii WH 0003]MCH2245902.1 hypothetical protein [Crocosphaera sp.]NQZ63908.1 hypothetical protein [Crocosphaera sp.]CCQ54006.1 hypothetical protein CWATWH0005_4167 [Crocosphaera watsonii WH 0005]CCQ66111.1 hypothetical protein CWATWH0402_5852 [Crocosphaera watsonii WH 0402]